MSFFYSYYSNIIKYDLINKFSYQNVQQLPQIRKIVLHFRFKKININFLVSALMAFQLITSKSGSLIKANKFNTMLKIKKGNPVGCKIILTKTAMYFFFFKFLLQVSHKLQQINITPNTNRNKTLGIKLKNLMVFKEIEQNYKFFKELLNLNILIVTNTTTMVEFVFLLKAFKLPVSVKLERNLNNKPSFAKR